MAKKSKLPPYFLTHRKGKKFYGIETFCKGTVTLGQIGASRDYSNPDYPNPVFPDKCCNLDDHLCSLVCTLLRQRLFQHLCEKDSARCTWPLIESLCEVYLRRYAPDYYKFTFVNPNQERRELTELAPDYGDVIRGLQTLGGAKQWIWGDAPKNWQIQLQYESHRHVKNLISGVMKCGRCQFFSPLSDECQIRRYKSILSPADAANKPDFEDDLPSRKHYDRGCRLFKEAGYDPNTPYLRTATTQKGQIFDRLQELFEERYTKARHIKSKADKYRRQFQIVKDIETLEVFSWGVRGGIAGKFGVSKKTYDRDMHDIYEEIKQFYKTDSILIDLVNRLQEAERESVTLNGEEDD